MNEHALSPALILGMPDIHTCESHSTTQSSDPVA